MSLAQQQRVNAKIRKVYQNRFMDGLCNLWKYAGHGSDVDGPTAEYGTAPTHSDIPCKLKFFAATAGKTIEPGLTEIDATITLPIDYLDDIEENDRLELTAHGTDTLEDPIMFGIVDQPLPAAVGLRCRVLMLHGEASRE